MIEMGEMHLEPVAPPRLLTAVVMAAAARRRGGLAAEKPRQKIHQTWIAAKLPPKLIHPTQATDHIKQEIHWDWVFLL